MKPAIVGLLLWLGSTSSTYAVVDSTSEAANQPTTKNPPVTTIEHDSWGTTPGAPANTIPDSSGSSDQADANAILTPFTARYTSEWNLGWFSIDIKGSRKLEQQEDGHWKLTFKADSSAATLLEESIFDLENGQIQPLEYRYKVSGLVTEPDRSLEFLPNTEIIRDHKKKKDHTNQWAPGIQDAQTYMLQASLDLSLHPTLPLSYPVFEKKKTKVFNFEIIGEEVIKTRAGKLNTVKIQQVRKDNRKVTVWLLKDKQFLLARLVDKKNGKTRYKIDLVAID